MSVPIAREEYLSRIARTISRHFPIDEKLVTETTNLIDDLDSDSLDLYAWRSTLEVEFDIEICDNDLFDRASKKKYNNWGFLTIGDFIDIIDEKVRAKIPS